MATRTRQGTPLGANLLFVVVGVAALVFGGVTHYGNSIHVPNNIEAFSILGTTGSLLIEAVYALLAIAAIRLIWLSGGAARLRRIPIAFVALATTVLAYKGTLDPWPKYPANRGRCGSRAQRDLARAGRDLADVGLLCEPARTASGGGDLVACGAVLRRRLDERADDPVAVIDLRVPLDPEHEPPLGPLDRLDQVVERRGARDDQALPDLGHPLVVVGLGGVHQLAGGQRGERVRDQPDVVVGAVEAAGDPPVILVADEIR